MKLKYFLFGGIALAMAACADENITGGNETTPDVPDSPLSTATVTMGQWGQTRASNVDTWTDKVSHDHSDWSEQLSFKQPSDAINLVENPWANASVGYIPASHSGPIQFNVPKNAVIYNYGENVTFQNCNFGDDVTVYNAGDLTWTVSNGNRHTVYNTGSLTVMNYANIGEVYNKGDLVLSYDKQYYDPGKADIPDAMTINSIGGVIEIPNNVDFKASCDIHNMVYVTGDIKIQNSTAQYVCGLEVEGDLDLTQGNLKTANLKANEIKFDGAHLYLLPEAHVVANKISMINSASEIYGHKDSHALIETIDFYFRNHNNFMDSFSDNIYFKVNGKIDIEERIIRDNGQVDNETNIYNSLDEYLASQNGQKVADRFNSDEISGTPECGAPYGTNPGNTPEEVENPLELVTSVESPTHDHNADKNRPNRFLSATCIDWDGSTIYVSYHMRGGNWGNDTYDKDEIEGCIETWQFGTNEDNQTKIELGRYMWSNDFDFNHLIIDDEDIITVGNHEKKGAFIGRITNTFKDFQLIDEDGNTYSSEMKIKALTTDVPVYGPSSVEGKDDIIVDYENAGDGNCVIRVGDEYFVATFRGYGRIKRDKNDPDEDFRKVTYEDGEIAFVKTPYSAKHIINNNGQIAVLYLNEEQGSPVTASMRSTATLATFTESGFPFTPTTTLLASYIQPVDGKNVLAAYNGNYFSCMGKGGLVTGNNVYHFGQNNQEPVNGICIDDEYIYLASGSHLRVLDHSMNQIAAYAIPNMSANYIKVVENPNDHQKYIIVAFGQEGVKVFRLNKDKL